MDECKLNICIRSSKTIEKKVYNSRGSLEFDRDEAGRNGYRIRKFLKFKVIEPSRDEGEASVFL